MVAEKIKNEKRERNDLFNIRKPFVKSENN
jgi:hypothetical protein